jgi:uncharacterized membrane protein YbhN (UPF0104 family)
MNDHATSAPSGRSGRQALVWAVKILVSGGLLYWLFNKVDAAEVWAIVRTASVPWLIGALGLYLLMIVVSAWRWGLLLSAQEIEVPLGVLTGSFLVATFFNNFLPSNIGGDVIRIRDTARPAGSRTLATTVVLLDRGIGLLGLVFLAALGASVAARRSAAIGPVGPSLLWAVLAAGMIVTTSAVLVPALVGLALRPLRALHQEWVGERIERLTGALGRFRKAPRTLVSCFAAAVVVQALIVGFYTAVAQGLRIPIAVSHLAILVPLSFIVQMLPVSVNGFGVREQTFNMYFAALHLPLSSALALSLTGAVLIMLFSTSGAVVYIARGRAAALPAAGGS